VVGLAQGELSQSVARKVLNSFFTFPIENLPDLFRVASSHFVDRLPGGEVNSDPRSHTNRHETEMKSGN
jgi:hypothetical protein